MDSGNWMERAVFNAKQQVKIEKDVTELSARAKEQMKTENGQPDIDAAIEHSASAQDAQGQGGAADNLPVIDPFSADHSGDKYFQKLMDVRSMASSRMMRFVDDKPDFDAFGRCASGAPMGYFNANTEGRYAEWYLLASALAELRMPDGDSDKNFWMYRWTHEGYATLTKVPSDAPDAANGMVGASAIRFKMVWTPPAKKETEESE